MKMWKALTLLFMIYVCNKNASPGMVKNYLKVYPPFPSYISSCKLKDVQLYDPATALACTSLCINETDCRLACYKDRSCQLFSALVSQFWNGGSNTYLKGFTCYSSWADPHDITQNASMTHSSCCPYSNPSGARDGFYCVGNQEAYHSHASAYPWMTFNFNKKRFISKIKVFTRDGSVILYNFKVYIGNATTTNGDVSQDEQVAYYPNYATPKKLLEIAFDPFKIAKHVTLQADHSYYYLVFGEMQIIEY